jgi:hypothetical protein
VSFCPGGKMSDRLLEQRINIKFCVNLGKCASEALQMFKEANVADDMKKSRSLNGIKGLKRVGKT